MSDDVKMTPVEVRAPRGAQLMEVVFEDGHVGQYPHEVLRGFCPCAVCQGHQGPIRFRSGGNTELTDLGEIGDYALRLTWGDGHSTGIYTFRFLRELCSCEACSSGDAAGEREFARG